MNTVDRMFWWNMEKVYNTRKVRLQYNSMHFKRDMMTIWVSLISRQSDYSSIDDIISQNTPTSMQPCLLHFVTLLFSQYHTKLQGIGFCGKRNTVTSRKPSVALMTRKKGKSCSLAQPIAQLHFNQSICSLYYHCR